MRAKHAASVAIWLVAASTVWGVQESTTTWESPENEQTTAIQASEAKGAATQPVTPPPDRKTSESRSAWSGGGVTPLTEFPEKPPYEQALNELAKALDLFNSGHFEEASDMALEAYDDLNEIGHVPRVKRSQIRYKKHEAATIYIQSSIEYIKKYMKQTGNTPDIVEEARYRLEDLRDVARDYVELKKMLNSALQELPTPPRAER